MTIALLTIGVILFLSYMAMPSQDEKKENQCRRWDELKIICDIQRNCGCEHIHPIKGGFYECSKCLSTYDKTNVMICCFCDNVYPTKNEYNYKDKGYCCKDCYEAAWNLT